MKRMDLNGRCSTRNEIIEKLNLRPSVERRIMHDVYHYNIDDVRELCMKSEQELLLIPSFSEEIVAGIKLRLLDAGLHFGMTEEELDDYLDAEYLENPQQSQF